MYKLQRDNWTKELKYVRKDKWTKGQQKNLQKD